MRKNRGVLKFADCNNFEVPLNSNHPEDFTYFLDKKPIDENVINTLNKAATNAHEQSNSTSIPLEGFQISLMGSYILKVPKSNNYERIIPKNVFSNYINV